MKRKSAYWAVHTPNLLKETITANPDVAASPLPRCFDIFGKILFAVADRARELNDPELNSLMCRLTLFSQADPHSEDFDRRIVDFIHKWDEKLIERISNS